MNGVKDLSVMATEGLRFGLQLLERCAFCIRSFGNSVK